MPRKKVTTSGNAVDVDTDNSVLTDIIVDSLNKKIGDVAYIMGKGESPAEVKEWLSTGSTVLDTIISNDTILKAGDASFTLYGGHTYEILEEDTLVYEYKTGPYEGQELDKTFIDEKN